MSCIFRKLAAVLGAVAAYVWVATAIAVAEPRIGLVITTEGYAQGVAIEETRRSGDLVERALERNGFQVTVVRDPTTAAALTAAFDDHARRLKAAGPDAVSFVYVAGQTVANRPNGATYLMPRTVRVTRIQDAPKQGLSVDKMVSILRPASRLNLVAIDGCGDFRVPGSIPGCADLRPQPGVLILTAAKAGSSRKAAGSAEVSPLATALAEQLAVAGQDASTLFKRVAEQVAARTAGTQVAGFADLPTVRTFGSNRSASNSQPRFVTEPRDRVTLASPPRATSGPARPAASDDGRPRPPTPAPEVASPDRSPTSGTRGVSASSTGDWDVVPVFYGTNRKVEPNEKRAAFSWERGSSLALGHALVTVPKVHKMPNIERPWVYKVPFTQVVIYGEPEDPNKHFTLKEVRALSEAEWLRLVKSRLDASKTYARQALIFVHGFNTTFDGALFRSAQIAYDLRFDGAPFVYSWPSKGELGQFAYNYDRESAEGARPQLREFIELVAARTGAERVSIIAHSMGHIALVPVLEEIRRAKPRGVAISEVIFAAPDMERGTFERIAGELKGLSRGVTLYASKNDLALLAASKYWTSERAGGIGRDGPVVVPGLDTIDVSNTSTDWFALHHSTYAERTELIDDIRKLMLGRERLSPPKREPSLTELRVNAGVYWQYPPRK